jgi:hypothetical protein
LDVLKVALSTCPLTAQRVSLQQHELGDVLGFGLGGRTRPDVDHAAESETAQMGAVGERAFLGELQPGKALCVGVCQEASTGLLVRPVELPVGERTIRKHGRKRTDPWPSARSNIDPASNRVESLP